LQGKAMWWFSRKKPKEAWEETIQWPIGDIEAAERIRRVCRSAADSSASAGHPVDGADRRKERDAKKNQDDGERYKGAARTAMEIAMKMSDDLMRDAGVSEIIELCLKANDIKTARILFRAIQSPSIRDSMLSDHPALRP
jgi:hypothetical protein